MADVMLVLLIIFMITAPLIAAGFQATMPSGVNLIKAEEQPDDVVLGMDRDGNYYINTRPIAKADVTAKLREIYTTAHTADRILYLKADVNLKMDKVQQAIGLAREAGVAVIAAVTEQRLGSEPTVSQERGH
ncbi:MAG: ExbD/TolR family protein [Gemmatimonadales bacterium]